MVKRQLFIAPHFLTLCLVLLAWSCAKSGDQRDYEERDVKEFVKPGLPRAALISRFGAPELETKASDGTVVLIFHRPTFYINEREHLAEKVGFTGFNAYLRHDKVVGWDAITSGPLIRKP